MQNTKTTYKNTEIGPIPEDWDLKEFQDISFMKGRIGWQGLNQNEFNMKIDDPFLITGMNFKDGQIRWHEVYHISEERYQIAKEIQLRKDDVLITKDGTIGKLLYIDNIPYPYKASLNSHLLVFRPLKNSYIPKFLYYQLSSKLFKDYIELIKYGTTFFGISQEGIGKYKVILPSLTEQKAIATALSDTDALLSSLEQLIAKKRAIKLGAMQELLKPKDGWEVKKLGDIAEMYSGGTPLTSKSNYYYGNIPWVVIADITKAGKYIHETEKSISSDGVLNSSAKLFKKGILLFAMYASIGKTTIAMMDTTCNQAILGIHPNEMDSEYLYYFLSFNEKKFAAMGQTGTQSNLSKNMVQKLEVPIPQYKEEQTHIATILSDMDEEIATLQHKLDKYKQIKQGMMQQLLTGKIRLV
jgi:type I restriction enzyme S subunit